ncbi:MAG TPA: MBL fold metallo-hydrolase [Terriglobales bacterium]|nr:MBL fold metallo-hydrolase [Terriglobales bacterium]
MALKQMFLRQNVMVEPLFNQWYAWAHLIPPATAAMNISSVHLKIMQSFVSAPQTHVAAVKNPAMRGGPFIDYGVDRVSEISALLEKTRREQAQMLQFASAFKELDEILAREANGYSLECMYQKVPDLLKGFVELQYDLNDHPSIRLIEGLLYKSEYYEPRSQSIILSLIDCDQRPFVFSTPRLPEPGKVHLNCPFGYDGLDELFKTMYRPRPVDEVREVLQVGSEDEQLFLSFFTDEQPTKSPAHSGPEIRFRYYGHACVLIEAPDVSILCDPVISYQYENGIFRYPYVELPETIDYVLITHNHQDHVMLETLLQLRHKIRNIIVPKSSGGCLADPSLKLALEKISFRNVFEIDELEEIPIPGGIVQSLPFLGEHSDLSIRCKSGYLIRIGSKSIMCVADSNNIEPNMYQRLRRLLGSIDVLCLGMECDGAPLSWLYGPYITRPINRKNDQSRRLNGSDCEAGLAMVDCLAPKEVYVYAMGQEPWLSYLTSIKYTEQSRPITESNKLVAECKRRGITAERLFGHKEIYLAQ